MLNGSCVTLAVAKVSSAEPLARGPLGILIQACDQFFGARQIMYLPHASPRGAGGDMAGSSMGSEWFDDHQNDDCQQQQHREFVEPTVEHVTAGILVAREALQLRAAYVVITDQ